MICVVEIGLVRPGPIVGDMVHPYSRRRMGLEPITYPSEAVRRVLERTLGIPIWQEQAMELAVVGRRLYVGRSRRCASTRHGGVARGMGTSERFTMCCPRLARAWLQRATSPISCEAAAGKDFRPMGFLRVTPRVSRRLPTPVAG